MVVTEKKKGEMTVREAGHLGIKKVASKGGKATAAKVPRIQEENREMEVRPRKDLEKGEMTVREAGHIGGKTGGHKGGEAVAGKAGRIHEENREREAHRPQTKEERERVSELVEHLKKEDQKR